MIKITDHIAIDESEVSETFVRASGPGGQHVNRVATAVQLRFNIHASNSLPDHVKERLIKLAGSKVNTRGILIIDARRFRTQMQNRTDAYRRLKNLIAKAAVSPKKRRKTVPTHASIEKRLKGKRIRSEKKRFRREKPEIE